MTDKDYTHIAMVVDRSGSMHGIHTDMNGAILKLLSDQAKEPGYCIVDIVTFDSAIEHPYEDVRPDDVKGEVIVPRGSTALNDAIGFTIDLLGEKLSGKPEDERPGTVIVVVVTDGMENCSRKYTTDQVRALVKEQTDRWNWQFIYLAANVDAFATGAGYGFNPGSTIAYASSSAGTRSVYDSVSKGMSGLRANMSRGTGEQSISFSEKEREEAMEE